MVQAHAIMKELNTSLTYKSKHSALFFQLFSGGFKPLQSFIVYIFYCGFQSFSEGFKPRKISVLETKKIKIKINTSIL